MKTKVFSVFDSKAAVFGTPFFMPTEGAAVRAFTDAANDGGTLLSKHPEDFSLFLIAEFDDGIGVFEELKHQNFGLASSFKKVLPSMQDLVQVVKPVKNGSEEKEVVR